jgi:hypothetical protein
MTPLEFIESAQTDDKDDLGYQRLSLEEVEWLLERGFEVSRTVFGCDIVSYPMWYIVDVLHPGCTWGAPHFITAEVFMARLWGSLGIGETHATQRNETPRPRFRLPEGRRRMDGC